MKKWAKVLACSLIIAFCTVGVASAKDKNHKNNKNHQKHQSQLSNESLELALAGLDQALVPALFETSAGDQRLSEVSMTLLNSEWADFRADYENYRHDYNSWGRYIDIIETEIVAANSIVFSGAAPVIDAHEALEGVRVTLVEFREKIGFSRFVTDKLTLYHEPMEAIVLTVKGKTPLTLTDAEVAFMVASLPAAEKLWEDVEKCPVDPSVWGFSAVQMATYYGYVVVEHQALDALKAALASGNKQTIIATGMGIKQKFVPVYTFFGDFESMNELAAQTL